MKFNIRVLYLYLFSFVGLIITVIGTARLIDLGLKVFVFKNADMYVSYPKPQLPDSKEVPEQSEQELQKFQEQETNRQRQRETASALSMIIVGAPLYLYHWKSIKIEKK